MNRRLFRVSLIAVLIYFSFSLVGCQSQSDASAQKEARQVARTSVYQYLQDDAGRISQEITQELMSRDAVDGSVSQEVLARTIKDWLTSGPKLTDVGLNQYVDAFIFYTEMMQLDGIDEGVFMSFTVIVPVDDKNVVAETAASILPSLRVDHKRIDFEMVFGDGFDDLETIMEEDKE